MQIAILVIFTYMLNKTIYCNMVPVVSFLSWNVQTWSNLKVASNGLLLNSYMITWQIKHKTFFVKFWKCQFWKNDSLILPIFWRKSSSTILKLVPYCNKLFYLAYMWKSSELLLAMRDSILCSAPKLGVTPSLLGVPMGVKGVYSSMW